MELEQEPEQFEEPVNPAPPVRKGSSLKWFLMIGLVLSLGIGAFFYLNPPAHSVFQLQSVHESNLVLLKSFEFKEPIQKNWKEHAFKSHTYYTVENDSMHAVSKGNSSMIYQEVKIDFSERPFLTWDWKAVQFPGEKKGKSLADKSNNDFTGRVYAIFKGRSPVAADVIQYVWDDRYPEGTSSDSPFLKNVRVLVVQNGPATDWVSEQRDILQDYQTLFGRRPRWPLSAVGIMSDSDNTKSQSEIYYRNLAVKKPQPKI